MRAQSHILVTMLTLAAAAPAFASPTLARGPSVVTTAPDPAHPILSAAFQAETDTRTDSALTGGNALRFLENGATSGPVKRALAASAQKTLFVTTMNWSNDATGTTFANDLIAASARGVDVRVIADALFIDPRIFWHLRNNGVEVIRYNAAFSPGSNRSGRIHQKLVVADFTHAVVGGPNVGDSFWLGDGTNGYFHDCDVLVEGKGAVEVARHFLTLWASLIPRDTTAQTLLSDAAFALPRPAPPPSSAAHTGETRFLDNEPDVGKRYITDYYVRCIRAARQQVIWHINNFDPVQPLLGELEAAAARGVRVILVINSAHAFRRHFLAPEVWYFWVLEKYAKAVLKGKKIETYFLDEPIHSKAFTVDGVMASVGSFNFHTTAVNQNLECTLIVHDQAIVREVEQMFDRDIARSRRVY